MTLNWIWEENLEAFVQVVARLTGYSNFNEDDWTAIQYGIRDTDVERNLWYEYPLPGDHPMKLKVAKDIGTAVLSVCFEGDMAMRDNLGLVFDICQNYRVRPLT